MISHDTIHAAFAQSLMFQKAKFNLNRAQLCLLISERHWKKVNLYSSQLAKYDDNWRNPQAMTKQELDEKIIKHQRKGIDYFLMHTKFKFL